MLSIMGSLHKPKMEIEIHFLNLIQIYLLILDEPFNTLDEESVLILKEILIKLKQQGTLIIITSHNKEDHEQLSDQIFEIKNGMLTN